MHNESLKSSSRRHALFAGGGLVALMASPEVALAADAAAPAPAPAAAAGSAKPLPAYATWKDADAMIVHSPITVELKRKYIGNAALTPSNRLYVRNHMPPPSEDIVKDPDAWEIEIAGVAKPAKLTVADLKRIGLNSVTMVLQCSGNGRAYFPHKPAGSKWTEGAAGCVEFAGVPVKSVVAALGGLAHGGRFMTSTGGELLPKDMDPLKLVIERSVPISDTLDHALLAWELNGVPIPLANGGPLRMVVPGFFGINNVKYVKRLAFTKDQTAANIQQNEYRFTPVGVKGSPKFPTMWKMAANSWITTPYGLDKPLGAGKVQIAGVAFGGYQALKAVEVSIDGGRTWRPARWFGPDMGRFAWRNFVLSVDLKPGKYRLASRATDATGKKQPEKRAENEAGFNDSSWADRSFEIEVA